MAKLLQFRSTTLPNVKPQRVWWKLRWADQWTAAPYLWASQVEWACNPSLPAATLRWRYGSHLDPGAAAFAARQPERDRVRYYVKIEIDGHPIDSPGEGPLVWYGTLEVDMEELFGPLSIGDDAIATGINHFTCYGLEFLLDQASVTTSQIAASPASYVVARGLPFRRNRSVSKGGDDTYAFHNLRTGGKAWSTRDAVEYLLRHHTPRDFQGIRAIPFELNDPDGCLPTWDDVSQETDGRTTRELLNSLIARQRLGGYRVDLTDTGIVQVRPFSFAPSPLVLTTPPGAVIPANPRQFILAFENDRGAEVSLKRSTLDEVEQVRTRGARGVSVGSWSPLDTTIANGWTELIEVRYEAGASTAPDYPAEGEVAERILRNAAARATDALSAVYSRFVMPANFDGLVGDGEGTSEKQPLVPGGLPLAPDDQRWLQDLPLLEGMDYSSSVASPVELVPAPHDNLQPFALFRRQDWESGKRVFRQAESAAVAANQELTLDAFEIWSARVRVDAKDGALRIDVTGDYQHAIAKEDFTPLPDDFETSAASFRKMIVTAAVAWSGYAEAVYPESPGFGEEAIRSITIDVGDAFRCDYVVPNTVLGINPATGQLVRSAGGYIRDDRPKLRAIAELAYRWYSQVRRALTYRTTLVNSVLRIGDLVSQVGNPAIPGDVNITEVNSIITSIRVICPTTESDDAAAVAAPSIEYQTAFAEIDGMALIGGTPR